MMLKSKLSRYEVTIAVGMRKQYSETIYPYGYLEELCQSFVNEEKTCVTVTPTRFLYVDGNEPGAYIRLINYPRFPSTNEEVFALAERLAYWLMTALHQERCSIMTPTYIYLYENPEYSEANKCQNEQCGDTI